MIVPRGEKRKKPERPFRRPPAAIKLRRRRTFSRVRSLNIPISGSDAVPPQPLDKNDRADGASEMP